jgi:hypothetical protein
MFYSPKKVVYFGFTANMYLWTTACDPVTACRKILTASAGTINSNASHHTTMASKFMASKFIAPKFMASKFMAPKFMGNAAFEARLLRPSHQRTVWTVNKLERPIPGPPTLPPILSSRSYSDSTSTPPLPKSSSSTERSQSSGPEDKNWFHSKTWDKVWGWAKARYPTLSLGAFSLVRAGSFLCVN